jgi:hypothetical protein
VKLFSVLLTFSNLGVDKADIQRRVGASGSPVCVADMRKTKKADRPCPCFTYESWVAQMPP